jgi:hypothetical protein
MLSYFPTDDETMSKRQIVRIKRKTTRLAYSPNFTKLGAIKLKKLYGLRERTMPTERPPLVGEVIANFCG